MLGAAAGPCSHGQPRHLGPAASEALTTTLRDAAGAEIRLVAWPLRAGPSRAVPTPHAGVKGSGYTRVSDRSERRLKNPTVKRQRSPRRARSKPDNPLRAERRRDPASVVTKIRVLFSICTRGCGCCCSTRRSAPSRLGVRHPRHSRRARASNNRDDDSCLQGGVGFSFTRRRQASRAASNNRDDAACLTRGGSCALPLESR